MKRDWDLVRKILIAVADLPDFNSTVRPEDVDGYQKDEVSYHISIMRQAGFLNASCVDFHDTGTYCIAQQLTWEGQELLSKIREQGAWNKVKGAIRTKGFDLSYEALKMALGAGISHALGG
jgi:hypothetical protein